jgi:5-methyltetrahydrofolate--homocysteine methyltransferase
MAEVLTLGSMMAEGKDAVYRERASAAMVMIARDLRQRETSAEYILWAALRSRRLDGLKFRRQHPIAAAAYVADSLCYEQRLIIEVDGEIHDSQWEADRLRESNLEALGYRILRFTNAQILTQLEDVLVAILQAARDANSDG